jgi:hypothetical protein
VGVRSRGRFATTPADFPSLYRTIARTEGYTGLHVRRESVGAVPRSRTIFCRPVPNTESSDSQLKWYEGGTCEQYIDGWMFSLRRCSPSGGQNSCSRRSNWYWYCWTRGKPCVHPGTGLAEPSEHWLKGAGPSEP